MAGENSFGSYDFGVTSNSVVAADQVDSFLNETELKPVSKPTKKTPLKEEDGDKDDQAQTQPPVTQGPLDLFAELGEEKKEEEEDDTEDEDNKPEEEKVEKTSDTTIFEDLSQELHTLGIFTSDDDEEELIHPTTAEEFAARWDMEKKKGVGDILDKWLSSKGDETRQMFQAVMIDGVDPKVYLQSHIRIQDIANLDITDEHNQERIVEELYRQNGKKDPKAAVQKIKDYGDLESEAQEAKEILSKREEEKLKAETDKVKADNERKAQTKAHYNQSVHRILLDKLTKKEFDGIPVNKQFAESIAGYITQDKYQTSKGEYLTEFDNDILLLNKPENYELKVKMAMLLKMVKEDPSLSKIKKTAVSKETNALFNKVAERVSKTEKTAPPPKQKGWFTENSQ